MFNYRFDNRLIRFNKNNINFNVKNKKIDSVDLNLINPEEIYDFIKDKNGIMNLIIKTHLLIKEYFPNAELYLKLHDDPESDEPKYKLFTHILNDGNTAYENVCIFDDLLSEFVVLKSSFPDLILNYSIIIGLNP